jgi:glutamate synthase (NADPH/NADH) small chain
MASPEFIASKAQSCTGPAKLAWQAISRDSPHKRPAAERRSDFREIYELFDEQTVREQASRCIQCPDPMCRNGCPLGNRIPEWLELAAEGRFLEAAEISQATSNMPEICSRVCPQELLCEGACILTSHSAPVAIGAVEKFINEYAFANGAVDTAARRQNGLRVGVVGAGPAGLACADELAKLGFAVTVIEALASAGGLLVYGIPSFKLDKSVVARRVKVLQRRGVQFLTGVRVGGEISLSDLQSSFDAVFLSIGAQKSKPLDVPGANLKGVQQAVPFLVQTNLGIAGNATPLNLAGKRVVVLGGGDTAMDCLRSALRCGASDAACFYRRDETNMPGSKKEYVNALEEGARFEFLTAPVALEGNAAGEVAAVRCIRMELGEPDASGRRKPRQVKGSEFTMPADLVLVAYGFDPVPFPPGSDFTRVKIDEWGRVVVDDKQSTSAAAVFSGGDLTRGPSLVVHAVRDGRRAAEAINQYLTSRTPSPPRIH